MGEIGKYSEEIFLTIFLVQPYFSVQIVQVENEVKRFIFSEFFINVQVVQAHLGEIGKYSKETFLTIFLAKPYFSVQIVQVENRLKRFIFSEFFC